MIFMLRILALLSAFCFPTVSAADSGQDLFDENCAACHGGDERGDDRAAPPIFAVQSHYLSLYPDKDAFVNAVVGWVEKPEVSRAQMPGAIRRFALMPAIELSDEVSRKIAAFIYDGQFKRPGW